MSNFVNTVDIIGDSVLTDSIITRSITEFRDNIVTNIKGYAFFACKNLKLIDLVNVSSFGNQAFGDCSNLETLIIRNTNSVPSIGSLIFNGSMIEEGTGYIYVPASMVDAYKNTSGWNSYNIVTQIRAIEDYPKICDTYTWDVVFQCVEDGSYNDIYKIGDLIPLDLGSEGLVNMEIVAFDTDDLADGSGKAPITFISKELLKTGHRMNPSLVANDDGTYQEGTGTIGGWEKCEMRTYLKNTIKPLIPENVRNKIKEVTKYSESYDTSGTKVKNNVTTDSVWIPSSREIVGGSFYETLGVIYSDKFTDSASRKKRLIVSTSTGGWWLRSDSSNDSSCFINTSGNDGARSVTTTYSIALGFCL